MPKHKLSRSKYFAGPTEPKKKAKKNCNDISDTQRNDLWRHWYGDMKNTTCVVCQYMTVANDVSCGFHAAHVTARKRGGVNTTIWNRIPTCASCNRTADTRNLLEYIQEAHPARAFYILSRLREIFVQCNGPVPKDVHFVADIVGCELEPAESKALDDKLELLDGFDTREFLKRTAIQQHKAEQLHFRDKIREYTHTIDALELDILTLENEIDELKRDKNKLLSHRYTMSRVSNCVNL